MSPAVPQSAVPQSTVPGLAALDDEGLPVPHGFFGRQGGVSDGIYASLNCGLGSDDEPSAVRENRGRITAHFGLAADRLMTLYQVHSARAVMVSRPWTAAADGHIRPPEADALATCTPGLALGILSADCAPVLLADAEAGVIGAAHAGWRGARGGVVEACIAAMISLGAERGRVSAVVGPCIGRDSYEVAEDFRSDFGPDDAALFRPGARAGHYLFDLPAYVLRRLNAAGVARATWVGRDTVAEAHAFFSFRRSRLMGERDYGRQLSVIALPQR